MSAVQSSVPGRAGATALRRGVAPGLVVALVGGVAAGLAGGLVACGRSEQAQEADRVGHAIDLVRDAPNDPVQARRDLLAKLAAEPAKEPQAIAARDACVAAYTPFLEGQALEAKVRGSLAGSPGEVNLETLAELGQAEAMLEEAKLKMPECDRTLHDLKHAHR